MDKSVLFENNSAMLHFCWHKDFVQCGRFFLDLVICNYSIVVSRNNGRADTIVSGKFVSYQLS